MDITGTIDDREITRLLDKIHQRSDNMLPVMTRIGARYERRVLENFANETAPDGSRWEPLAETTLMMGLSRGKGFKKSGGLRVSQKRYLQGKRILWEHGDMSGSVHHQATRDSVVIGAGGSIPYAAIHQKGGKAGRGRKVTIPAREYLAMNEGDGLALASKDREWILRLLEDEMARWR